MADHAPFNDTEGEVDTKGQEITYTFSVYMNLGDSFVVAAGTEVTKWVGLVEKITEVILVPVVEIVVVAPTETPCYQ